MNCTSKILRDHLGCSVEMHDLRTPISDKRASHIKIPLHNHMFPRRLLRESSKIRSEAIALGPSRTLKWISFPERCLGQCFRDRQLNRTRSHSQQMDGNTRLSSLQTLTSWLAVASRLWSTNPAQLRIRRLAGESGSQWQVQFLKRPAERRLPHHLFRKTD
jgi:hypothetical protein